MSPATPDRRTLWLNGLWHQNPALVQLLGLCPLLAVSNTAVNGLSLGLATLLTLVVTSTLVSALKASLLPAIRIPLYVMLIATTVTLIEITVQAWSPSLHATLGIFLPLIVTNCLILGRAEAFASRQPLRVAVVDSVAMGTGFLLVLLLLGMLRELLGRGTVFTDMDLLLGEVGHSLQVTVFAAEHGVLLAILPPGAFIALGLILALKNRLDQSRRTLPERPRTEGPRTERPRTEPPETELPSS